ncbi:MAG: molybdenum cofactor synthesis domain-containing protein [Nannocystaceae bacterium]
MAPSSPPARAFIPLRVAVVTVSDSRTSVDDHSGAYLATALREAGHLEPERVIVRDELEDIRGCVEALVARDDIDIVLTTGGTGFAARDVTPDAVAPLATRQIPGFGELFRRLSFEEVGTSTIQSRADAFQCGDTFVFVLPGSTGACRLAMGSILLDQLDHRHRPCNFAELLPRIDSRKSTGTGNPGES